MGLFAHPRRWAAIAATAVIVAGAALILSAGSTNPRPGSAAAYGPQNYLSAAARRALFANPAVDAGSSLGGRPAPGFTLTNQFGHPVSLAQLRGRVVLLAFVDPVCTTICPLTTASMLAAAQQLGPAARDVALVGVVANPNVTSVAATRAYSAAHGLLHRWQFLTGSRAQLAAIWKAYGVYVAASHGQIDHEAAVYLIDRRGHEQANFLTQMALQGVSQQAAVLAAAVRPLLPPGVAATAAGSSATTPAASLRYQAPVTPRQQVTLPSLLGGPAVTLGPGQPRLVVFLAGWLSETTNLVAQLQGLVSYQRAALAHGWPRLIVVDATTTEITPGALTRVVDRVPGGVNFPVVADPTGRVADGYGFTEAPWYVLVSAAGKTQLQDAGWFPVPALERAVAGRVS